VALALGLDPGELEPESRVGEEDLYEGIAGAGSPSALPSPLQPLLEAVTEEISFRWRTATEGKWSPSAAPAPRDVSCTPYVYLEVRAGPLAALSSPPTQPSALTAPQKRLRRWDSEAYAAAGLLPYLCLNEGGAQAQAELGLALGGAEEVPRMELLSGGAGGASEPPCLPPAPLPPGAPPGLGASPLDGFYVLLARQGLAKRRKTLVARLLLLGGKRERADSSPLATALREAREETIGLLGARRVRPELLGPVLWFPQGRFALFLYNVPPSARDSLPTAFAQRLGSAGAVQGGVEVDALEWVPLVDVLARSRSHRRGIAPFARAVVSASPLLKFFVSLGADKLTEARNAADEGRR